MTLLFIIPHSYSPKDNGTKNLGFYLPEENTIGTTTREFEDRTRSNWLGTGPRPVRVIIWYPSDSGGVKELVDDEDAKVTYLKDGKISAHSAKHPLILISPGSGQNALSMRWLGYYLSSHGYITIAISHNGTAEEERQKGPMTLTDFCIWERPKDLSVVLNSIMSDSVFAERIDVNRIGAAGFSLGGAVAIWTAGARLNLDSLHKNAPPPPPQLMPSINRYIELSKTDTIIQKSLKRAEKSFKDDRIKAVFALAPAVGYGFTKKGLSKIDVPVRIVVGDKDIIAPADNNAKRYSQYIKNAEMITLPGELGHYTKEIPEEQRAKELKEVSKLASEFFHKYLGSQK
ncbi:MAG: alpha/beta hydrolase family protein [Ignavibacteria bacterium]